MDFSPPPNKQWQPSLNPEQFVVCYKYCAVDIVSENRTALLVTSHRFNSNFYMMEFGLTLVCLVIIILSNAIYLLCMSQHSVTSLVGQNSGAVMKREKLFFPCKRLLCYCLHNIFEEKYQILVCMCEKY